MWIYFVPVVELVQFILILKGESSSFDLKLNFESESWVYIFNLFIFTYVYSIIYYR